MRVLVLLAHPDPASLNHALARQAVRAARASGHRVTFHDLYRERFPAVLPAAELSRGAKLPPLVARHCRDLAAAEGLVIVHPNWWGQPPAILKGWVDRVVRPGVAYEFREGDGGEGVPVGLLKTRTAVVLNTSNTPARREREAFGDPLGRTWADCILKLCGVREVRRRMFRVVVTSTAAQRKRWLAEAGRMVAEAFPPT